jgi:hypothetical protein
MTNICVLLDSLKIQTSLIFVGEGLVVTEETREGKEAVVLVWWAVVDKL